MDGHPVLRFKRTTGENRRAYFPVELRKTGAFEPEPPGNAKKRPDFRLNRRTGCTSLLELKFLEKSCINVLSIMELLVRNRIKNHD